MDSHFRKIISTKFNRTVLRTKLLRRLKYKLDRTKVLRKYVVLLGRTKLLRRLKYKLDRTKVLRKHVVLLGRTKLLRRTSYNYRYKKTSTDLSVHRYVDRHKNKTVVWITVRTILCTQSTHVRAEIHSVHQLVQNK